jgi:hypothetical protein
MAGCRGTVRPYQRNGLTLDCFIYALKLLTETSSNTVSRTDDGNETIELAKHVSMSGA